jgi:hypothetical protein
VFKALENSNGTEVKFTGVCDPDDDASWATVLELLLGRDDVYGLVPLTRNRTVQDLYAAHVNAESEPRSRACGGSLWFNLEGVPRSRSSTPAATSPGTRPRPRPTATVCLA